MMEEARKEIQGRFYDLMDRARREVQGEIDACNSRIYRMELLMEGLEVRAKLCLPFSGLSGKCDAGFTPAKLRGPTGPLREKAALAFDHT